LSRKKSTLKFGIALETFTPPGKSPTKESIVNMAKTAERLGFESVWVWDHLLLGSRKVFPVIDSLTTLSYLSSSTSKLKLGTSVLIMTLRNPLVLVKALSAIQIYSNGRLVVGAASGWYEREFRATGVNFDERGKIFEEEFQLVGRLLNDSDVSFKGEGFELEHATILPKSATKVPMLIGGYSRRVLRRAGRLADGWISYYYNPKDFSDSWNEVKKGALDAKKDPDALTSVDLVPLAIANSLEEGERTSRQFTSEYMDLPKNTQCNPDSAIKGNTAQCISQIKKYQENGVDELVFIPSFYNIEQVEKAGNEILPSFLH
jgi:probable F420-dependent oxidoreductase